MEKILGRLMRTKKVGSTMADPTPTDDDVDLSSWEFVNPSSDDDEDIEDYFFDDSGDDEQEEEEEMEIYVLDASSSDLDLIRHDIDIPDVTHVPIDEPVSYDYEYKYYNDYADDHEEEEEEEEKEDYDDDDDEYDDELVPRSVSDRFGKQRLMKLGKKAKPKMNNPKKLPCYYYNRPGGVHGKNHVVDWKRKIVSKKEAY